MKQIAPQKARGKLQESYWDDLEWIAEEKYDGDRRIAQFCTGVVRFTGCRESVDGSGFVEKTDNLPHLNGKGDGRKLPHPALRNRVAALDGTVLDGEIIAPPEKEIKGGRSKYVTSVMGSLPDEACRKQIAGGFLRYVVFDCLWFRGADIRDLRLRERYNYRDRAVREWGNDYVSVPSQQNGNKTGFYDRITDDGGEGVVLKHIDHRYGDATGWVKVKKQATADVVVMGFTDGRGKYAGQIGAIRFGQYRPRIDGDVRPQHLDPQGLVLVECGQCSGVDDDMRGAVTRNLATYKGKVMEIRHNGREPTGKFRHPRFVRFRSDKKATECIYDPEES